MKIMIIYDYPDVTHSIKDVIDVIDNSGLI